MMERKSIFKLVFISIVIGVGLYIGIFSGRARKVQEQEVLSEIEGYGYLLHDNDTDLYKENFDDLAEVLEADEIDESEYAKLIAKLFIIDFYTLDNKLTKNDVGGSEFVIESFQSDFISYAETSVYKYLESNIYGNRDQILPVVREIEIMDISRTTFTFGETEDAGAFKIEVEWRYKKDLGYETETVLYIMHDGEKLAIVEME